MIRAHLQGLDTDSFVVSKAQDILDWVDATLVDAIFQDAKCGHGICESPSEYPGFGRFGCAADCGKYKMTSRIMLHFEEIAQASAAFGWDWSKVPRPERPIFTYNIWSDTMGDWLFEQPLKANGSNVLVDVPGASCLAGTNVLTLLVQKYKY